MAGILKRRGDIDVTAVIEYFQGRLARNFRNNCFSKFDRSTLSFKRRASMILFRFLLTQVKIIKIGWTHGN